jgi:hypothetical protein
MPAATTTPSINPPPDAAVDNKCPSCSAPLASGAILCVNCGYNLKTGKTLSAVVVETDGENQVDDEGGDEENAAKADEERA